MYQWLRKNRLALVVLTALLVSVLSGCGGTKKEDPAPALGTQQTQTPVDKDAIVKEAATNFLASMPQTYYQITAQDLKKRMDEKDPTMYLVDIRKAEDFAKQWVEGFTNIPFLTLGANMDKLPKDKQIIVSCYTGQTASEAVAALRIAGYNVLTVRSGWSGIEQSGVFQIKKAS